MATLTQTSADATVNLQHARKTITFAGGAGTGAVGTVAVFTVTGKVLVTDWVNICTVSLVSAGGGSIALGVSGTTGLLVAATTATAITSTNFVWQTTTPTAGALAENATQKQIIIGANVIITVTTGDVTAGSIIMDVYYRAVTDNGLLS